ncbi:hypothetical protein [uncultured Ruminococcus sp.]|uniref:hypothetical protein n=1 Tax=uncultured Ruminococcus sp. TaxID=165186 RepID=UPI0026019E9A|nr:hypothetical protein [uncultured Ruminococcus sp.]
MISWRSPLFSAALAREVRQIYTMQVQSGHDAREATDVVIQRYQEEEPPRESAPVFWMSLAAVQLECGALLPEVRSHAVYWINQMLALPMEKLSMLSEDDICACMRDVCALKCWIFREKNDDTVD